MDDVVEEVVEDTDDEVSALTRAEVLQHALEISEEYASDGMDITLRQLYYQFVSLGLLVKPDNLFGEEEKKWWNRQYKRIGSVLSVARFTGDFPLDQIVDRGRDVLLGDFTRCDADASVALRQSGKMVQSIPDLLLDVDRWYMQPYFVSVWVEKQALEGVFQPVCEELGVSSFSLKGYPSVSALWSWLQRANEVCGYREEIKNLRWPGDIVTQERHCGMASKCVVLYFGDHDPDGIEIPRSAERNIRRLMDLKNIDLDLEFVRVGLNLDQVKQYNPPPFEAKIGARQKGYLKEFGISEAWELDALNPRVLRSLIRDNVENYFDEHLYGRLQSEVKAARIELRGMMKTKISTFLEDSDS